MKPTALPQPLEGIVPPLVTPLEDRETLAITGTGRLIEHVIAGGVSGLFVLGTTGEGPSLPYAMRQAFMELVVERVAGRVPVLVGITDASAAESIALAEFAADAGAQAVVLAPPFYYGIEQVELVRHVEYVAAHAPLPLFLYNMPSHTGVSFAPNTVRRLIDVENIVGIKNSSANMIYFHEIRELARRRPGWTVLMGPEELLGESVLLGGHGGVCGGANLFPRLYVELYRAARSGNRNRVAQLHAEVMRVSLGLYRTPGVGAPVLLGIKCGLMLLGICDDAAMLPFDRLPESDRNQIARRLGELDPCWRLPIATPASLS